MSSTLSDSAFADRRGEARGSANVGAMLLRWIVAGAPCTMLCATAVAAAPTASPPPGTAAALMARVLVANVQELRGVVGFETTSHLNAHAGFFRRDQDERRWFVLDNGILQKTGLKPGSDAPFGKASGDQKHEPWGPYGGEYQFAFAPCPHCAPGIVAIGFTSDVADEKHGHGTLLVDEQHARVVHETFVPNVVAPPARTATIDTDFGATGAGWFPRTLSGSFTGRLGPFTGSADLSETFTGYRHFASMSEAETALEGPSTPPPSS